jgi:hypothetical protein
MINHLYIGRVPRGASTQDGCRMVASVESTTGPPGVSPLEVEDSTLDVGRVTVHRIPHGDGGMGGMLVRGRGRRRHGRMSSGEKVKSDLMGIGCPKPDPTYPFSV